MITNDMTFEFKWLQFPVRLAFALSINKSEGQSLSVCDINLENSRFLHGQYCLLPVPLSEYHQHYLFTRQKTKLTILCIQKHYNKHYIFEIFFIIIAVRIEYL